MYVSLSWARLTTHVLGVDHVQDSISQKLCRTSGQTMFIKLFQHRLTLVILAQVGLREPDRIFSLDTETGNDPRARTDGL